MVKCINQCCHQLISLKTGTVDASRLYCSKSKLNIHSNDENIMCGQYELISLTSFNYKLHFMR